MSFVVEIEASIRTVGLCEERKNRLCLPLKDAKGTSVLSIRLKGPLRELSLQGVGNGLLAMLKKLCSTNPLPILSTIGHMMRKSRENINKMFAEIFNVLINHMLLPMLF